MDRPKFCDPLYAVFSNTELVIVFHKLKSLDTPGPNIIKKPLRRKMLGKRYSYITRVI